MRLTGKKVLSFIHHEFEDLELWYPILRLREEGAQVDIAGEESGVDYIGKYGVPATSNLTYAQALGNEYDAIIVPGGWAPDKIRRFPDVLELVRRMDDQQKPIGQICHAGWVLISANILTGRKVTSTPGIKDDMVNAGAEWFDESVVVDGHLVSSRRPPDLPDYLREFIKVLENS